jgi:acyl-CoA hydrolase
MGSQLNFSKHFGQASYVSADDAVACIKSGDRVFIHGSAATPVYLVQALQKRYKELNDIELVSITNLGTLDIHKPEYIIYFSIYYLFRQIPGLLPIVWKVIMYRFF